MDFAIVADDLTGAMDSGVRLVGAGYRAAVVFHGAPTLSFEGLDAVSADTDSRALEPEAARERVMEVASRLKGARVFYKKIDSTLRGNLAVEIEAAMEATGRKRAVVAPAFPASGRTTEDGVQLVHGVPVHETELARDPRNPVRESHLPTILAGIGPVASLGVEDLDELSVRQAMEDHRIVVAGAETDEHLEALAAAVSEPSKVLWVGSAGLAGALGAVYPGTHVGDDVPPLAPYRRVLAVVGSRSEVSREQSARLITVAEEIEEVLVSRGGVEEASRAARGVFGTGKSVLLRPNEEKGDPEVVVRELAEVSAGLAEEGLFEAMILTGGDTAIGVARRLEGEGILIEKEIEAGVPVGVFIGRWPCRVVTKAGAFGSPDTLETAFRHLVGEGKEEL